MLPDPITDLLARIYVLEEKLENELEKSRAFYDLKSKITSIREEVLARHRALRQGLIPFFLTSDAVHLLIAPVIYSLVFPIFLLDVWVTLYQHVCFRAFRIPRVPRRDYVVIDRQHLAYLNGIEVLNCLYCGYGNGVFAYAREVASRTEQYWCPIKHARRVRDPHQRYLAFLEYGDAEGFRNQAEALRDELRREEKKE